jgi:hypothetical protein
MIVATGSFIYVQLQVGTIRMRLMRNIQSDVSRFMPEISKPTIAPQNISLDLARRVFLLSE